MDKPRDKEPSYWDRAQRVLQALVAMSSEAAKVADSLRRILR